MGEPDIPLDQLTCGTLAWFKAWVKSEGFCIAVRTGRVVLPDYCPKQQRALLSPVEVREIEIEWGPCIFCLKHGIIF